MDIELEWGNTVKGNGRGEEEVNVEHGARGQVVRRQAWVRRRLDMKREGEIIRCVRDGALEIFERHLRKGGSAFQEKDQLLKKKEANSMYLALGL